MRISKDTLISEIISGCPDAIDAFQSVGMHCIGCAMSAGETLEQACEAHDTDPDDFLDYLNGYLESIS